MEGILIRDAVLEDLPELRQFEQGVITAERPFDPTIPEGAVTYYDLEWFIRSEDVKLVVAEVSGELIGSGYARRKQGRHYLDHKAHAYLGFMFTKEGFRGKGVNKMIMDTLMQWAKEQGLVELRLTVYHGNAPAVRAYEKVGFDSHMNEMRFRIE